MSHNACAGKFGPSMFQRLRRPVLQELSLRACKPSYRRQRTLCATHEGTAMTNDSTPSSDGHSLEYRGFRFDLRVEVQQGGYRPVVVLLRTPAAQDEARLPDDTEEIVYGTAAEATRHAEQQAMRWVHDRTGDGRGQF